MADIATRHPSVTRSLRPRNMAVLRLETEQRILIEREALSIFTDCTNANMTFRDALSAVLLSGINWGIELKRVPQEAQGNE